MDINLRCAFHMTLIFNKYLELSKGCVVNVSCALGTRPNAGTIGYCMTKAGLEMLFTIVHPQDAPGRKLVAEVEVHYDLPGANLFDQVLKERILITYGDDERAWSQVEARVQRRYNEAFVEKQQLRARQLVEAGQTDEAVKFLNTIKKRGNEDVARLAEGTIRKIQEKGGVDNEELFRLKMGTQKKKITDIES